jgi:hypothetical protein
MMTEAAAMASTTTTAAPAPAAAPDPTNPWAHLTGPSEGASAATAAAPEAAPTEDTNANAEDIQIAWENLEAARMIVERMLLKATTLNDLSETEIAKLQL